MIGRQSDVEVLVTDGVVSRRHARIFRDRDSWRIEDLGSRAGVRLNGRVVPGGVLRDGDQVMVGTATFDFHAGDDPVDDVHVSEHPLTGNPLLQTLGGAWPVGTSPAIAALLHAGERLRGCDEPAAVARVLMLVTATALRATGAWVLRFDPGGQETITALHAGDRSPSRTFVRRVVDARAAVLVEDTAREARLRATESLLLGGRKSLICAPLWDGDRVSGVLYLESTTGGFQPADVDLAVAVAHLAAAEIRRLDAAARHAKAQARHAAALRFLPAPLAAALADADLDAADRAVVVVAIELAGYDTAAGAAPVTELLDALIGVAVDQCGATLIEASPTALRLLFGAPTSAGAEFDAHAAVTAATRLVREMDHRRGQQPAWAMVRLRVGVHAGSALVGLLGPARRLEYRAVGPAVDGAVAAMNASFPGRVLATGAVVAELAGRFEAVPEPALLADGPGFWIGTGA